MWPLLVIISPRPLLCVSLPTAFFRKSLPSHKSTTFKPEGQLCATRIANNVSVPRCIQSVFVFLTHHLLFHCTLSHAKCTRTQVQHQACLGPPSWQSLCSHLGLVSVRPVPFIHFFLHAASVFIRIRPLIRPEIALRSAAMPLCPWNC